MIIGRASFESVVESLRKKSTLSLDTETTGLRPFHGDRLFSLILGWEGEGGKPEAAYFNFWPSYPDFPPEQVLDRTHLEKLRVLFDDPEKSWLIHNASFDLRVLWAEGVELAGQVWCTMTQARVEYNEHFNYDLDSCLKRIGLAKNDLVEKWIEENHAWEWEEIPGKQTRKKNKFYYKVPPEIIVPYGLDDAKGCFSLGRHQVTSIAAQAAEFPRGVPSVRDAALIEQRLAKTIFRLERVGVKIDRPYCLRAAQYETDRLEKAAQAFKRETGRDYAASPKLFETVFASDRSHWQYTEKGNPSFESDVLRAFENPAAAHVKTVRDAKAKLDFYNGFLYHADRDDVVHANFKAGGTRTFRFSSSEPNLQNLTAEEATYCNHCKEWYEQYADKCPDCEGTDLKHPEFMVRRAIVPRPGFVLVMPDFDQMEYKMMLDYAKHMTIQDFKARGLSWDEGYFEVANKVRDGFDVHKATAELMGVPRKYAKTLNFMLLYGGRAVKLTLGLLHPTVGEYALWAIYKDWKGFPPERWEPIEKKLFSEITDEQKAHNLELLKQAEGLIKQYFRAVPYVEHMVNTIQTTIRKRGWVRNWAGYKYTFPDRNFAYTGANTIIQGGCAAVTKGAMNAVDEYLLGKKSRMVLTIHDELPLEVHESELGEVPRQVERLMVGVYPHKYIPLTVGMEWSDKSLADKQKGFPA